MTLIIQKLSLNIQSCITLRQYMYKDTYVHITQNPQTSSILKHISKLLHLYNQITHSNTLNTENQQKLCIKHQISEFNKSFQNISKNICHQNILSKLTYNIKNHHTRSNDTQKFSINQKSSLNPISS